MPERDSQLLKGVIAVLLLQLLSEAEDYGYAIVVRLQAQGFPDLAEGTVYPALTRLEGKGWLTSRLVSSESGPARKYYHPTDAGRHELKRSIAAWRDLTHKVDGVIGTAGTTARKGLSA